MFLVNSFFLEQSITYLVCKFIKKCWDLSIVCWMNIKSLLIIDYNVKSALAIFCQAGTFIIKPFIIF